jgi:hypothetical protein
MQLVRFPCTTRMPAAAINIRHIFHCGASRAAVFTVCISLTATIWMCAFLCVVHFCCLLFPNARLDRKSFACDSTCPFDAPIIQAVALVFSDQREHRDTLYPRRHHITRRSVRRDLTWPNQNPFATPLNRENRAAISSGIFSAGSVLA